MRQHRLQLFRDWHDVARTEHCSLFTWQCLILSSKAHGTMLALWMPGHVLSDRSAYDKPVASMLTTWSIESSSHGRSDGPCLYSPIESSTHRAANLLLWGGTAQQRGGANYWCGALLTAQLTASFKQQNSAFTSVPSGLALACMLDAYGVVGMTGN